MMSITCSDQYNIYCDLIVGVAGGGGGAYLWRGLEEVVFCFRLVEGLPFPLYCTAEFIDCFITQATNIFQVVYLFD